MRSAAVIAGIAGALAFAGPVAAQVLDKASHVFIASDSTAADYAPDQYPQMGWGMFLGCSLDPAVEVVNMARGGRSTKTFQEEGLWAVLLSKLRAGDTVLIQFGHNDADMIKPWRHTVAGADYDANLTRFVADVRARGAQPVLMTPVARHAFANGRIKETHGDYALAVRSVAAATRAPLIDLDADSMAFLDGFGEDASKRYFMIYTAADGIARLPEGRTDTTHLNELGARATAGIVAGALAGLDLPISKQVAAVSPATVKSIGSSACK